MTVLERYWPWQAQDRSRGGDAEQTGPAKP
jgi:hypothetical protein